MGGQLPGAGAPGDAVDVLTYEEWRPVRGWEGYYAVSNLGRVWSETRYVDGGGGRRRIVRGKVVRPHKQSRGYLYVCLRKDGRRTQVHVARLVADAFYGPPEPGEQVNHGNYDRHDNRKRNLGWTTPGENVEHRDARRYECEIPA